MAGVSGKTESAMAAGPNEEKPAMDHLKVPCWTAVRDCARFLRDEKAMDVQVLHVTARASFADFFIIATAQSIGQLRGFVRNIDEVLARHDVRAKGGKRTVNDDDTWVLLDCGDFIIHLMMPDAREFYDLEKLWFDSPKLAESL